VSRRRRRQKPVSLSPLTAPPVKSKSIAISITYLNLSTSNIPPKAVQGRRLISLTIGGLFRPALGYGGNQDQTTFSVTVLTKQFWCNSVGGRQLQFRRIWGEVISS